MSTDLTFPSKFCSLVLSSHPLNCKLDLYEPEIEIWCQVLIYLKPQQFQVLPKAGYTGLNWTLLSLFQVHSTKMETHLPAMFCDL
jgi:hypothetical protein